MRVIYRIVLTLLVSVSYILTTACAETTRNVTIHNRTREPLKITINTLKQVAETKIPNEPVYSRIAMDPPFDIITEPESKGSTTHPLDIPYLHSTTTDTLTGTESKVYEVPTMVQESGVPCKVHVGNIAVARSSDEEDTTIATAPVPDEVIVERGDFLTPADRLRLSVMEEMLRERKRASGTIHNETPSDVTVIFRNLQNPAALNSLIVPPKSTAFFPALSAIIYGIESDTSVDTTALPTGTIPTDALTALTIEDVPYYVQLTQGLIQRVARVARVNRTVPPGIDPASIPNFAQAIFATNTTNVPVRVELPGALDELPVITVTLPPYGPNPQSVNVHGVHSGLRGAPIPSVSVFNSTWYSAGPENGQRRAIFRDGQLTIE